MSAFELAAWNWYCGHVNRLVMDSGLLPMFVQELGLTGRIRELFVYALNMIYTTFDNIAHLMAKKEASKHG